MSFDLRRNGLEESGVLSIYQFYKRMTCTYFSDVRYLYTRTPSRHNLYRLKTSSILLSLHTCLLLSLPFSRSRTFLFFCIDSSLCYRTFYVDPQTIGYMVILYRSITSIHTHIHSYYMVRHDLSHLIICIVILLWKYSNWHSNLFTFVRVPQDEYRQFNKWKTLLFKCTNRDSDLTWKTLILV